MLLGTSTTLRNYLLLNVYFILLISVRLSSSKQIAWNPFTNTGLQNSQWDSRSFQPVPGFVFPNQGRFIPGSISNAPMSFGKFRLLSTLWKGMRSTGVQGTIAGEILQSFLRAALKDIIVPFKSELFSSFA